MSSDAKKVKSLPVLKKSFSFIHKHVPSLLPAAALGSFVTAIHPFINIYFPAKFIQQFTSGASSKDLILTIVTMVILNVLALVANELLSDRNWVLMRYLAILERKELDNLLFSLPYETYESTAFQKKSKKFQASLETFGTSQSRLIWIFSSILQGLFSVLFSIVFLLGFFKTVFTKTGEGFIHSPWFAVSVLAVFALALPLVAVIGNRSTKKWYLMHEELMDYSKIYNYYNETLVGKYKAGKEIRIYNESDYIFDYARNEYLDESSRLQKKMASITAASGSVLAIIGGVIAAGVYLLIGTKGLVGVFPADKLVLYMGSFLQIVAGIIVIFEMIGGLEVCFKISNQFFDLLSFGDTIKKPDGEADTLDITSPSDLKIEFKNVSFKYPKSETYALKDFSITLSGSEHLAVVGKNGSGKTTMIKLLCRMYDVTDGEILVNEKNIKTLSSDEYQKLFSVVFQDYHIFSLPLAENVSASVDFDDEKMWNSLKNAGIDDWAKKQPLGLDTYMYKDLKDDGIEISGGESQKIALARALYKDAPVIVLDEPTASLDPIAEAEVYEKFNSITKGKLAIYVSHRLSSCRFCDRIAVLDEGQLIEAGTHDELLADESGLYNELWNAQAQHYFM